MKTIPWPPSKDELVELRRLAEAGNESAREILAAAESGILASQSAIDWYIKRKKP